MALQEQVAATKAALRDFSKNKGDDGKAAFSHTGAKFRMDIRTMAKHLQNKERMLSAIEQELRDAEGPTLRGAVETFADIRKLIEPLAVRSGNRRLKEVCCELVVDSGNGLNARRALRQLRVVGYRQGVLADAKRRLSAQLATMGV